MNQANMNEENKLKPSLKRRIFDSFSKILRYKSVPLNPQKICLIKIERLGDTILSFSTMKQIRKLFPSAKIVLITNNYVRDLLKNENFVDEIVTFDGLGFFGKMKLFRQLRKESFDLGVDLTCAPYKKQALYLYLTKAKCKIGFDAGIRGIFLDIGVKPVQENIYESVRISELLKPLNSVLSFGIDVSASKTDKIDDFLKENKISLDDVKVIIHPSVFGEDPARLWSPEKYSQLADNLIDKFNAKIIFSGTNADLNLVEKIRSGMKKESFSIVGKTNLQELSDIISRSNVLISGFTGVTHLSVALNTPAITICGSTPTDKWADKENSNYSLVTHKLTCGPCEMPDFKCEGEKFKCIKSITVDEVLDRASLIIKKI